MLGVHNQFLIIVAVTAFEENDVLLQGRHQEKVAHREDIDEDNNMSPRPDTTPHGFDGAEDRCVWSQEVVNQYIGGCSKNCEYFDTAQKAMSACNAEMTCGGVTYQKGGSSPLGGFQLRSGGSVRKSPSNETSWVCQRPTAPTLAPLGYVHMPHQCVLGKNIVKYANKSVGQCADLCNEDRTCEGFEYGVAYGGAGVYQPADCQLDSSADTTDCDGRHYNLDFYSKAFVQPGLSTQVSELIEVIEGTELETSELETSWTRRRFTRRRTTPAPQPACVDVPGWHDIDGRTYTCAWYSEGTRCASYGHGWSNFGKTANQACCTCKPNACACVGSICACAR